MAQNIGGEFLMFIQCNKCKISKNIECFSIYSRKICKKCKTDYRLQWRKNNLQRDRLSLKNWQEKNRKRVNELAKQWRDKNVDKTKIINKNNYAKRKKAIGKYKLSDIRMLKKIQRNLCNYCGVEFNENYHIDHIIPLSNGGVNNPHNLQLLCPSCNLRKGAKDPSTYEDNIGFQRMPMLVANFLHFLIPNGNSSMWVRGNIAEFETW